MSSTVTRTHRIVIASAVILLLVGVMIARSSTAGAGMSFNEGLENIGTDGQTPTGWWRAGYGTNTVSWSFASQPHGGKIAQSVKISNWRSGDRKLLTDQSGSGLPVIPGRSYDLSSWYRTDGVATIVVYRRTTSGYWTYWTSGSRLVKSSSWKNAKYTTPKVPSGTVGISFGVALASNGTLSTDDYAMSDYGSVATSTTAGATTTTAATSTTVAPPTTTTTTTAPTTTTTTPLPPGGDVLVADEFSRPDGLITNEYAYWNPSASDRITDPTWSMTSGSLFAQNGTAWSGLPDDREPNATSSNGTDSAIFRMISKRTGMSGVEVSFRLRNDGFSSTLSTPEVAWDGIHVFLRYSSEESLYYASVNRRDGTTQIKKKVPGGVSNGGTYYTLGSGTFGFAVGAWQDVKASIVTQADGTVKIQLWANGRLVASAVDSGVGGPVIGSGRVGLRGDNTEFAIDSFVARSLG
jgi:hypothetical protein